MAALTAEDVPLLSTEQAEAVSDDTDVLAQLIQLPFERWAHQCHAVSSKLMRSGAYGRCCLARGTCKGVGSQHSWVVLGDDPYAEDATAVDPTLWSYMPTQTGIFVGRNRQPGGWHRPHGSGGFWEGPKPQAGGGEAVTLTPAQPFSAIAQEFLNMLGPLDRAGWSAVAHMPVEGWPAREILSALCDSGMGVLLPIDIRGMAARREPGYFWPEVCK